MSESRQQLAHKSKTYAENIEDIRNVKDRLKKHNYSPPIDNISTCENLSEEFLLENNELDCHPSSDTQVFTLSNKLKTRSNNLYTEEYDENEHGLSWGTKTSHDGKWQERWLQQEMDKKENDENTHITFGRSVGNDTNLNQRWTVSWKHNKPEGADSEKIVKRHTQKFEENNPDNIVEDWNELITIKETNDPNHTIVEKNVKTGLDKTSNRRWTETVCETIRPSVHDLEQSIKTTESSFAETFQSTGFTRERHCQQGADGETITTTRLYYQDDCEETMDGSQTTPETVDSRSESTIRKDRKNIVETKDSNNRLKERLEEIVYDDGTTETINIIYHEDGTVQSTKIKKTFHSHTGDVATITRNEMWEKREGDKWGHDEQKEYDESNCLIKEIHEKWYDNTKEKVVDRWVTEYTYDEDRQLLEKINYGTKRGDRYSDGTEWGENWGKTYQIQEDSETACLYHFDKWWKEPSGNRWGHKQSYDIVSKIEKNENWYDNGQEIQVDRWQKNADEIQWGEKFGENRVSNCHWDEKWTTSMATQDFFIEKKWQEFKEEQAHKWGEIECRQGQKQWKESWRESKAQGGETGSWSSHKYTDDGCGNFMTLKEGTEWREGQTIDWYIDKYGECLGESEKWAYKTGSNAHGDNWLEKWNESPTEKSALKEGSNARGDAWKESWKDTGDAHWAEKTGKNAQGEEWTESWWENQVYKHAKKKGKNAWEEWQEEWGETENPDGSGEKWTSKWAHNHGTGDRKGQNWGDRWGAFGENGFHWDEKWNNDYKEAYSHETPGRPEGC